MPLLHIHSLPPVDPEGIPRLLTEVRDAGSRALGCDPANVWVMFHALPPGHYLQGAAPAASPQAATHPPVVIARLQVGRSREQLTAFTAAVAGAVAKGLSIPSENVWVRYDEMRSEDVWFQGRWSA